MDKMTSASDDPLYADLSRNDELILVDPLDHAIGSATKERAHWEGMLHRAFSVVLTREHDNTTQVLLARRAACKYHAAGLWGNSCCSHPRASEDLVCAARRRVHEELGCSMTDAREVGSFVYRAAFSNGLTEYEYDHVLLAAIEGKLQPHVNEVDAVWWVNTKKLSQLLCEHPTIFAPWALTVLPMALAHLH